MSITQLGSGNMANLHLSPSGPRNCYPQSRNAMDYDSLVSKFNAAPAAEVSANVGLSLPVQGLPARFVEFCRHVAERRNVPVEVTVLSALTAAGAACGGLVKLHLASFTNNPAVQTLVIAPSGAGKSAPLADVMEPLEAIDSELIADYRQKLEQWTAANSKSTNPAPRPERTQLLPRTETDAALRAFCVDNPRGGLYFADEARTFFKSLGTKFNLNGCARAIEIFNGSAVKIDVAGDTLRHAPESFLAFLGGLQPALLPRTITSEHFDSGLMHRFLCVNFERRDSDEIPKDLDPELMRWWYQTIRSVRSLGNTKWTFVPGQDAVDAYADEYRKYRRSIKPDASAGDDYNDYRNAAHAKTLVHIHKLVLVSHLLWIVDKYPSYPHAHPNVSADTIRWAFSTAPFLLHEKMRLYAGAMGIKPAKPLTDAQVVQQVGAMMRRKNRQLNQTALAEVLGIDRANVSRYLAAVF